MGALFGGRSAGTVLRVWETELIDHSSIIYSLRIVPDGYVTPRELAE